MSGDGVCGDVTCPRCALGRHKDCTLTVLVGKTEQEESIWQECACHCRNREAHNEPA